LETDCFLLLDVLLNLIDKRKYIPHAENSGRQTIRIKRLESIKLLAHTGEKNRLANHLSNRKRRTAAGIAIQFGENYSGETQLAVEADGLIHGILTGHGVGDKKNLMGIYCVLDRRQLLHEFFVDVQTTRGIDQDDIAKTLLCNLQSLLAERHRGDRWIGIMNRQL